MTDYKQLCQELTDELEEWIAYGDEADIADAHALVDRARAALAEPEPEGPAEDKFWRAPMLEFTPEQIAAIEAACAQHLEVDDLLAIAAELEAQ